MVRLHKISNLRLRSLAETRMSNASENPQTTHHVFVAHLHHISFPLISGYVPWTTFQKIQLKNVRNFMLVDLFRPVLAYLFRWIANQITKRVLQLKTVTGGWELEIPWSWFFSYCSQAFALHICYGISCQVEWYYPCSTRQLNSAMALDL